jgi:death on curing protein
VDEPSWLDRLTVDAMHYDQMQQHGGLRGIKDDNALESALARPRHKWAYEPQSDLCDLAAAYGFGLATNHGYSDGNKRIAFLAMYVFLGINGWEIVAAEPAIVQLMKDVAARRLDEKALAAWLRQHIEPLAD